MADILEKAVINKGTEKSAELSKYLLAQASDGYKVIFTLTELDKAFTDRQIILTNNVDGKPLPAGEGPFRIIVQDEKKPARCIRQVISLRVGSVK